MINQTVPSHNNTAQPITFGLRLKTAREALGIDHREVASQLRLPENIIQMMESGEFSATLPPLFVRGYLRSYSKFLEIPEQEIKNALILMEPKPEVKENEETVAVAAAATAAPLVPKPPILSSRNLSAPNSHEKLIKKIVAGAIGIILLSLAGAGIWWYSSQGETRTHVHAPAPVAAPATIPAAAAPIAPNPDARTAQMTTPYASKSASSLSVTNTIAQPATSISQPIAHHASDKGLAAQNIMGNPYLLALAGIVLLFVVVMTGLHLTGSASSSTHTSHSSLRYSKSRNRLFPIVGTIIIFAAFIGVNAFWNNKPAKMKSVAVPAKPAVTTTQPVRINEENQRIPTEEEISALPQSNLNAVIFASLNPNILQALNWQLNDFLNQAEATRFELTDPNSPYGEFIIKTKKRGYRHHPAYYYKQTVENEIPVTVEAPMATIVSLD